MPEQSKQIDQAFERIAALEDQVRGLRLLLAQAIANSDFFLRLYAETFVGSVSDDVARLPQQPPNSVLVDFIQGMLADVKILAAGNKDGEEKGKNLPFG